MFTKTIIDSDAFLDMPVSTQNLYFHLAMRADDDGFINGPKKIQRMVNATDDDMRILLSKRFLLCFETGVIVIKHWRMHNYLRIDRYKPTVYQLEMKQLSIKENGAYTLNNGNQPATIGIPDADQPATQVRLGKVRLGYKEEAATASEPPTPRFKKPSLEEISAYCSERENHIDPQRFFDHYESNGWKVGKATMKDWRAAIRTWEKNALDAGNKPSYTSRPSEPPEREIKGVELPQDFIDMMERHKQRLAMQEPEYQNEPEQKEPENVEW
jgi:hypothetical protein